MYSIVTKFRITVPLVRSLKIYLNGSHSKTRIGKHLSDIYIYIYIYIYICTVKNLLEQGDAVITVFNLALYCCSKSKENRKG